MSFSLKLFGGVTLAGDGGPLTGPAVQRHRLALLALLATARPRAVSRDKLTALLWPERDSEPARHLLNQTVHILRQSLAADAILSVGDDLHLNSAVVDCDVVAFEEALANGAHERAVALYAGPYLDGFFLNDAPEFERWVERERARLAGAAGKAMEGLAEAAERAGESEAAVEWWKARAAHDPYDSRIAVRLMEAHERAGNRAGALQHAMLHQQLLREALEIEPPAEVRVLVERLRREPPSRASATTPPISGDPPPAREAPGGSLLVPAPRSRRMWYGTVVAVLALAIGGVIGLRAGSGATVAPAAVGSGVPGADAIAHAVARELERRARGDTARRLPQHRTASIPAYELYLRGSDPRLLRSDSTAREGMEYFRRALALDSNYAAAWAGLARLTYRSASRHPDSLKKAHALSEQAVLKALALDDSLAEGHAVYGVALGRAGDYAEAERRLRHAIELDPTQTRFREWLSALLIYLGRRADGLAVAERAQALDSLSPTATAVVAQALLANDRCDEALARLQRIAGLDPPLLRVPGIVAQCLARLGRWSEALAVLRPQSEERRSDGDLALLGYVYAGLGRREAARAIHNDLLERHRSGAMGAYYLAFVPAALGEADEAFAWLDRAYDDGSLRFGAGLSTGLLEDEMSQLRDDPRLGRLLERVRRGKQ